MKIFNPRHFLRHIAPTVLQDFVQSHPLGAHLSVDWTLPEAKLANALINAVENLQVQLLQDIALTTAEKVALEENLFRWNEDLRRAYITGTEAGAREFALALANDAAAQERLLGMDPREQALWMLVHHEQVFRDIELCLAFRAKTHGRSWKPSQILPDLVPHLDQESLDTFKRDVAALYQKSGGGIGAHIEVSRYGTDGSIQFSVAQGRLRGHVDGVLVGGPEGFAYPALWENKCLGAKSWRELQKHKLAVAKPVYAAQIAVYQSYLTLHEHPALFTAVNADTMEIYAELVPFDAGLAQRMSDRAVKVIQATEAGELLPRSFAEPTHFECRFCAWAERCWNANR